MRRIPNNTVQLGVYNAGGGVPYVELSGAAETGYQSFQDAATADSWADSDLVTVIIKKDDTNWAVWDAVWDETNEYLLSDGGTVEQEMGTLADLDNVTITATISDASLRDLIGSVAEIDQYDIVGRIASGTGAYVGLAPADLTEAGEPAAGDFLLGWSSGALRKFDVGALHAGSGSGSPYTYTIAAADTESELALSADSVCDGTADQVEINAAISGALSSGINASILLLPGSYYLTAAIDFTPYASTGTGATLIFDARAATIRPGGNLTSLIDIGPASGGQILSRLELYIGTLYGHKATYTVTQAVYLRRASDNKIVIDEIREVSGNGIKVDQDSVTDYGAFNNFIEIRQIATCAGSAFNITGEASASNVYGFQGNIVKTGQIIECSNGFIVGDAVNFNATFNTFVCGPIEHCDSYGIYDRCGANIWIVNNTNNNASGGIGCPSGMTKRSTITVNADDAIDDSALAFHNITSYGVKRGGWIAARAYNSANIAIANTTITAITLDTESYDYGGLHSTSSNTERFTIVHPGLYRITANGQWAGNTSGYRNLRILLNGSTIIGTQQLAPTPTGGTQMNCVATYYLNAGDYVHVAAYQNSGISLNLETSGVFSPSVTVEMI